jgi:chemotaxis response regulator CheB
LDGVQKPRSDTGDEASRPGSDQLVVIGSSAGGIEALSTLVATLPRDFPAPW